MDTPPQQPEPPISLRGDRVSLQPVVPLDHPELLRIAAEPEVARWWGAFDASDLEPPEHGAQLAIRVDGQVVGLIQFEEEPTPEHRYAGIDIFLTAARHGQGIGSEAISVLARYLFDVRDHHRLTIDPAVANARAIRTYERLGFRPVGVMRQCERGPDGTWHDGLLMDLLRGELVDQDPS